MVRIVVLGVASLLTACVNGAIGKCVVAVGYRPWKSGAQECFSSDPADCWTPTLEMHHEACVRMIRADYCGDGQTHTLDGIQVDIWDNAGVQQQLPYSDDDALYRAGLAVPFGYEAEWTPNGARCISDILMPRHSHAGTTQIVQHYLEGRPYCDNKWNSHNPHPPQWSWHGGQCFDFGMPGLPPMLSSFWPQYLAQEANVSPAFNRTTSKPNMNLRERVLMRNSSVCIDDEFSIDPAHHRNNHLKDSAEWAGRCLP
jgi:hypothetical protein